MSPLRILLFFFCIVHSAANARNFLVIGDSITCGAMGKNLLPTLTQQGHTVQVYCAPASHPHHWLNGINPEKFPCQMMSSADSTLRNCNGNGRVPPLAEILKLNKGAEVIVALGSNSLYSGPLAVTYQKMGRMIREAGSSCTWVGPPHIHPEQAKTMAHHFSRLAKNINNFYDNLATAVDRNCAIKDMRDLTASGMPGGQTFDGVHPTSSAGKIQATSIAQTVLRHEPLRQSPPPPPAAVTVAPPALPPPATATTVLVAPRPSAPKPRVRPPPPTVPEVSGEAGVKAGK